jgi:hypothetical protein
VIGLSNRRRPHGRTLPANKRLEMVERTSEEESGRFPETANPGSGLRAATMADSDLGMRPASEQAILDEVRIDDGWQRLDGLVDQTSTRAPLRDAAAELERFHAPTSCETAHPFNDALLKIGRLLVGVLYSRDDRYRQDPADYVPLLPELGHAELARGKAPDPVLRTELARARNCLEGALLDVVEFIGAARAMGE